MKQSFRYPASRDNSTSRNLRRPYAEPWGALADRTVNFNTGTRGFAAPEDSTTAVCILPGTELAFSEEVKCAPTPFGFSSWITKTVNFRTAIFRQVNKDMPRVHHDALEFPDGTCVLLTDLREGQEATVLQLPAQSKTPAEEVAQRRVAYVAELSSTI